MKSCAALLGTLLLMNVPGCRGHDVGQPTAPKVPDNAASAVGMESSNRDADSRRAEASRMQPEMQKTDEAWREQLTPEQYEVTRRKGTERAFTGQYWNHKGDGVYGCVCCGLALFDSRTKYDSGTGWPSFSAPAADENVLRRIEQGRGMRRTEVLCRRCGAHLGHVFTDGPPPTGQRYCINSAALAFTVRE